MSANNMVQPFGLHQIELTDAYSQNALHREIAYLLSLEPTRLLAGYHENAGLPAAERYGGWEKLLLGGHTLGHYLTAAAQGCVNAGANEREKEAPYHRVTA